MRRPAIGSLALALILTLGLGLAAPAASAAGIADTRAALRAFFAELDYFPIFVPADEEVGDVYRLAGWRLIDRAEKCFPSLGKVERVPSDLPRLVHTAKAEAGFLAVVSSLFKLGASGAASDRVVIDYRDVQKAHVGENDLRAALSSDCRNIAQALTCSFDDCADPRRAPLVLGTVLYARKSAFFGAARSVEAGVQADVDDLVSAAVPEASTRLLDASAAAQAGYGQTSGVLIQSDELLPVAFQPAFVPVAAFDVHRGPDQVPETRLIGVEHWTPYEPENPRHRDILLKLLELDISE